MNKSIVVSCFLLLSQLNTYGQSSSDAKMWLSLSINKKINDMTLSLSEEIRFDENLSHNDKLFTEFGIKYKLIKRLYVGINYRYTKNNHYETDNYDNHHRLDFNLGYKIKLGDFKMHFRERFQTKSDLPHENNPTFLRTKMSIRYKINGSFYPFVSYELFYQLNDIHNINRNRYSVGTRYKINDSNSIKLFYTFQHKFNSNRLENSHITGLSYQLDI